MAATLTQYLIGATITLDLKTDVTAATVRKIICLCPGAVVKIFDAELALNGEGLSYKTTSAEDLDITGEWTLQSYIESPSVSGYGRESAVLEIERALVKVA